MPDDWSEQLRRAIGSVTCLLADETLCGCAAVALESAFELTGKYDSIYVYGVADGFEGELLRHGSHWSA
jgi:hypothetical protein